MIAVVTPTIGNLKSKVTVPETDPNLKAIYDAAMNAYVVGNQAIQSYYVQCSIAKQMQEQAKWASSLGVAIVLSTCGVEVKDQPFKMVEININDIDNRSPLRATSIGKGDGLPNLSSRSWDTLFPEGTLFGMSKSPMAVANSILYNNLVFSNSLGLSLFCLFFLSFLLSFVFVF